MRIPHGNSLYLLPPVVPAPFARDSVLRELPLKPKYRSPAKSPHANRGVAMQRMRLQALSRCGKAPKIESMLRSDIAAVSKRIGVEL